MKDSWAHGTTVVANTAVRLMHTLAAAAAALTMMMMMMMIYDMLRWRMRPSKITSSAHALSLPSRSPLRPAISPWTALPTPPPTPDTAHRYH